MYQTRAHQVRRLRIGEEKKKEKKKKEETTAAKYNVPIRYAWRP